jgi:hypothetical protein
MVDLEGLSRRGVLRRVAGLALFDAAAVPAGKAHRAPLLPDRLISEAYEKAANQNVLAAVNPQIFPGYFSVCADGHGFGYGNTYPSLDGHQLTDALLWLGQTGVAKGNWDYVRGFQRGDGSLPIAILPRDAGKNIGPTGYAAPVAANGGLYQHWVPGNPLQALASPTYIQNADVIFRRTLDHSWLAAQIASVNLAADFLATLTTEGGAVKGGGYYVERPARFNCDGVTQPHAADAFRRTASLNRVVGDVQAAQRCELLAERIERNFIAMFWAKDHFAEYLHPERGLIDRHGLTDTNWAALAWGAATPEQTSTLWPKMRREMRFYYGGMPAGIATEPSLYETWEFPYPDKMDVASMGRVWYLECQARARAGDADGLIESIRRVCRAGRENGYYWRERYGEQGGYGAQKYCEYPANLIRIVQRFVLGVDLHLDGSVALAPTAPTEFWRQGFGQTISWRDRVLDYRMTGDQIAGSYFGGSAQNLAVRLGPGGGDRSARIRLNGRAVPCEKDHGLYLVTLPASLERRPCRFELSQDARDPRPAFPSPIRRG